MDGLREGRRIPEVVPGAVQLPHLDGCGAARHGSQPVAGSVPCELDEDVHLVVPNQLSQLCKEVERCFQKCGCV